MQEVGLDDLFLESPSHELHFAYPVPLHYLTYFYLILQTFLNYATFTILCFKFVRLDGELFVLGHFLFHFLLFPIIVCFPGN